MLRGITLKYRLSEVASLAVGFLSISCQPLDAELPPHSVSPSRQFLVYGGDAALRGVISQVAEETKRGLLSVLHCADGWKTPILINVQTPQANLPETPPARLLFSQTGFGVKLQLDIVIGSDLDLALLERELLRAILLEMIYRREPNIPAGTVYVQPPDWLINGLLAVAPGKNRHALLDALAISENASLKKFLQSPPISDTASAAHFLFRAYSLVLVQLLLEIPDGPARLTHYIENLSDASNDALSDLQSFFPSRPNLEMRWKSKLTNICAARQYEPLGLPETERRLNALTKIEISGPRRKIVDLDQLAQQRKLTAPEQAALVRLSGELSLLTLRAYPVLRPIVREYQDIVSLLLAKKRHRLVRRLASVKAVRDRLIARMDTIADYMNWFEATQLTNESGVFSSYLKAAGAEGTKSRRRDPLSVYLDSLEDQF